MKKALTELEKIKEEASQVAVPGTSQYNAGWHAALDLRNLLITSEAVTRAALVREESRGAHTRLDFPGERDEWVAYNVVSRKGPNGMIVEKVKRPDPPEELRKIACAKIEDLESG